MYLDKLQPNDTIEILIHDELHNYDPIKVKVDSTCSKFLKPHGISFKIPSEEKDIINLLNSTSKCVVQCRTNDGRANIWNKCSIGMSLFSRDNVFQIFSNKQSSLENRRAATRLSVNLDGSIHCTNLEESIPCIVADISMFGIGIIIDNDILPFNMQNRNLNIAFSDKNVNYTVEAKCIRQNKVDDTKTLYGCRLLGYSNELLAYIYNNIQNYE